MQKYKKIVDSERGEVNEVFKDNSRVTVPGCGWAESLQKLILDDVCMTIAGQRP